MALFLVISALLSGLCQGQKADLASEPRTVPELMEFWGYESETHWITTADGYILAVHRIPPTTNPSKALANDVQKACSKVCSKGFLYPCINV